MQVIHISYAGPERWLSCAGKRFVFEDHHYCGPIVLASITREPSDSQPPERHPFWSHVSAWYQQGKKTLTVGDKVWCVYETPMQEKRRVKVRPSPRPAA